MNPPEIQGFDRRIAIRIFLGALALRLVYLAETFGSVVQNTLLIDSATYDRFARLILQGGLTGENVYAMNVLYPYVLAVIYAVTGGSTTAALYVQAFAGALNAVLIGLVGSAVLGRRAGIVAGAIAALYGPYIFYSGALLTPTLIDTCGLGMLVLLLRHRRTPSRITLLLAGACLGLMALGRGNAILFLPLALPILWRWAKRFRRAMADWAVFALVPVLLVGGVTVRNARVAGELVPISANVAAFYIGHNPGATGLYVLPEFTRGAAFEDEVEGTRAALSRRLGRELSVAESARHLFSEGLAWARENPGRELELLGTKLLYFFNDTEAPTNLNYYFARDFSRLLRLLPLGYGILVPLALVGLLVTWRRSREKLLVLLYGSVFLATGLVFFVAAEYRNPFTAVLIVFTAGAVVRTVAALRGLARSGDRRDALATLGLLVVLLPPLVWVCTLETPLLASQRLKRVDYLNAGTVLRSRGDLIEAKEMFEKALEIDPAFGPAYAGLARVEHALGNELEAVRLQTLAAANAVGGQYRDEGTDAVDALLFQTAAHYANGDYRAALEGFRAIEELQSASGRTRDALRTRNNIGLCLYKLEHHDEAATVFRELLSADPTYVYAYTNLARVEAARGNWAMGDSLFQRALTLAPDDPRVVEGWRRFQGRSLEEP
jgi:tetratricopeptide (TPR) repeat protein